MHSMSNRGHTHDLNFRRHNYLSYNSSDINLLFNISTITY